MTNFQFKSSRRRFFRLSSMTLLTLSAVLQSGCDAFKTEHAPIEQRLINYLNHLDKAQEIGQIYKSHDSSLKTHSAEQLTNEILELLKLDQKEVDRLSDEKLTELLTKQIRQDFTDENIVTLGTWVFSKTELLLCALADSYSDI